MTNLSLDEIGKLTVVPGLHWTIATLGCKDASRWIPMHQGGECCVSHDTQTNNFMYEKQSRFATQIIT